MPKADSFQDVFNDTNTAQVAATEPVLVLGSIVFVLIALSYILSFILLMVYLSIRFSFKKFREEEVFEFATREPSFVAAVLYKTNTNDITDIKPTELHKIDNFTHNIKHLRDLMTSNKLVDKKIAILDADILLKDILLKKLGVKNATLGEMLKTVSLKEFPFREEAWRAHKIRNELAHNTQVSDAALSDIQDAWHIYENIFKYYIND